MTEVCTSVVIKFTEASGPVFSTEVSLKDDQ